MQPKGQEALDKLPIKWALRYYETAPWKVIGAKIEDARKAEEAVKNAQLDWEAVIEPVHDKDGKEIEFARAVIRKDTRRALGVVRRKYTPLQNVNLFEILDTIISVRPEVKYSHAGSMDNDKIVWVMAKLPTEWDTAGMNLKEYLLLTNSHDGTKKIELSLVVVRDSDDSILSIRKLHPAFIKKGKHTAGIYPKLSNAQGLLLEVYKIERELCTVWQSMTKRRLAPSEAALYFSDCFGVAGKHLENSSSRSYTITEAVKVLYDSERADSQQAGTLWEAFVAICVYADHVAKVKGKTAAARLESTLFGTLAKLRNTAHEKAEMLITT